MRAPARLALLLLVLLPATARAATFVYDAGAAAPTGKVDYQVNPNIPANQKLVAAEVNQIGQNEYDLRQALTWGFFHGLAPQTLAPPPPDSGILVFNMLDGGGFWVEFPDAGTQQVVLTLAGVATIPSIDAGSILTGTLTTGAETVTGTGTATFEYTAPHIVATTDLASSATLESSARATLDSLAVKGVSYHDGGVDLGVAGTLTDALSVTAVGTGPGLTVTSNVADSAGKYGLVINNATPLTSASDGPFRVLNNGATAFTVTGSNIAQAIGGFDFNSHNGTSVLAGTIATHAVNVQQIEAKTLSGSNPSGFARSACFTAQKAAAAAANVNLAVVTLVAGTNNAGGTCTTTIAVVDVTASNTVLCSKAMAVGAANTDTNPGSTETVNCTGLTIAANDVICAQDTASPCTLADGTYAVNASWW